MDQFINVFGEFKSSEEEREYLENAWNKDSFYIRYSYLTCCILMLFAGLFADYQRTFFYGSPNILTALRVGLVAYGLYFVYSWRNKAYSEKVEVHLFYIKLLSVIIVAALTFMVQGRSSTLLAGVMIMTTSFYVMLPGRLNCIIWNCVLLLLVFLTVPLLNPEADVANHGYRVFILVSLNIVLFAFRSMFNRAWRLFHISNRRLAEMNKTKDDVISTIAHDLKSPLQVIMSSAQAVTRSNRELSTERIQSYQNRILKAARKTDDLLRDLLSWAITSNESLGYDPKDTNIKPTIEKAIEFAIELAQTKELDIDVDLEDYVLNHDSVMIETCIRNIISNAIKFTPEGGKINVKGQHDENGYQIEVVDQGEGVPDVVINGLASGNTFHVKQGTKGEKGTGIGLKLVHSFLEKHNAKLLIENLPDCGSRVTLNLPLV
ncbi:GHKL domain protein [Halobacteriovorax sp. BALOs_7]|uniref:sensor histidine kinase n=1 Tax=Halobacteriovorax sp. BALOs_7 TaxID=2109558 RepID=UPI000EA35304|nr:HAMP domain-containing sensor histidine kinase [Halobacteriovorax sp. BALOs_7]AYF43930.1 GHKL domain protein [Halobacteriovorax sp. BALOs_7]